MTDQELIHAIRCVFRIKQDDDVLKVLRDRMNENARDLSHLTRCRVTAECLDAPDPLIAFASWYLQNVFGRMSLCPMYGVRETKLGMSMTMFELVPFRVELFLFKPEVIIPEHSHPDVDSFEVYIAGDMDLTIEGVNCVDRQYVIARGPDYVCMSNGGMIRAVRNVRHGGKVNGKFGNGAAFLSIQLWHQKWEDESVAVNWQGVDGSTHG